MRLSTEDRRMIKILYDRKVPTNEIAERFKISESRVIAIARRD